MSAPALTLHGFAALEAARATRTGRWFSLMRIAPVGWAALDGELDALAHLVAANMRRTDFVQRVREREVGAVLIETAGAQANAPVARIRKLAVEHMPRLELRIGCAPVGPGQKRTWQEGWRWAGELLVADAAVAAAA